MNENPPVEVVMALYELDPERVARFKGDTMPTNEQSTRAYWLDLNFYEWRAPGGADPGDRQCGLRGAGVMRGVAVGEKKVDRPGGGALPAEHSPARYANARVCRRCGQSWPCTFELGVELPDSRYANEAEEIAVAEAILTAPQAIRAAWAADALR